jgi:hypothetical protein
MRPGDEQAQRVALRDEASRIHESAVYSAQGQFEAAKFWRILHWVLGVVTAVLSSSAAVLTFATEQQTPSGVLAIGAAVVAAVLTGVRPGTLVERAQTAANGYTALRNDVRRYRAIHIGTDPIDELRSRIEELAARASELDFNADPIPRKRYERAKKNIERDGGQTFEVDR